ncbi:hypothetical protein E8E13_010067 [Curvularia kusanoi]|uniref:Uncharacterized protein n=1 Tax=Curvularia kusanoi TaxID=90978 RepID=A0A9P4TE99_CURKU|nr:hypothetical protein E8E13_010067 [Curvularia kusanoi]
MSSAAIPLFLALLQIAAAAPVVSSAEQRTYYLEKRLDTGPQVALGLCIPAVSIAVGLGIGIMWFYPAQRRKLREQNARRELHVANGTHSQRQGSEHATLPVYKEHEGSDHELEHVAHGDVPVQPSQSVGTVQPSREHVTRPPTDARHAALTV